MTEIQSDYELLLARVETGELEYGNLAEMICSERARNATLVDALKEWQVLYNAETVFKRASTSWARTTEEELKELILWLALPWGDNDPLFPESDGWTPRALEANARMKRTWQAVVRGNKSTGAVPDEKGEPDGSNETS